MKKVLKLFLCLTIIMIMLSGCNTEKDSHTREKDELSKEIKNEIQEIDEKTYLKEKGELATRGLFEKNGDLSYENSLLDNDMTYHSRTRLYYKIINNMADYNIYKERIEIPGLNEKDFENSFLLIVSNENVRAQDEIDLEIYDVVIDENVMQIIMKQKNNPNYYSETNVFYAVVDNTMLRNKINILIKD